MTEIVRLEWRDGKLIFLSAEDPTWRPELQPADDPDTFTVGPGFRQSGEPVRFRRLPDGRVTWFVAGGGTMLRLDLVAADETDSAASDGTGD
jgi:hypothetical protein